MNENVIKKDRRENRSLLQEFVNMLCVARIKFKFFEALLLSIFLQEKTSRYVSINFNYIFVKFIIYLHTSLITIFDVNNFANSMHHEYFLFLYLESFWIGKCRTKIYRQFLEFLHEDILRFIVNTPTWNKIKNRKIFKKDIKQRNE